MKAIYNIMILDFICMHGSITCMPSVGYVLYIALVFKKKKTAM